LESQPHLKGAMECGAMEIHVVVVLNIRKTLIPCTWMLRVIHAQDVYNHLIDNLCLAIGLCNTMFPPACKYNYNGQETMTNSICVNVDSMDLCMKGK
jgi:hypothetical protein